MMKSKREEQRSKMVVIVVLEGVKASSENTGISPLYKATRDVVNSGDEIIVLTILNVQLLRPPSDSGYTGDHRGSQLYEPEPYVHFLRQEISLRKEAYMQIFRPFYDRCKSNGVKFQVKVAAGFRPKDIIMEQAKNSKANRIFMDRSFVGDLSFRLSGTDCSVSFVNDDEEPMVHDQLPVNDGSESSMVIEVRHNPQSAIPQEEPYAFPSLPVFPPHLQSFLASTYTESENPSNRKPCKEEKNLETIDQPNNASVVQENFPSKFYTVNHVLRPPVQLSWEAIVETTGGFARRICTGQDFLTYIGYLADRGSKVMARRFTSDASCILEAEQQAALSMHHKNILGLIGYCQSENATILVFPYAKKGSLHRYFCGMTENELKLTFQEKLQIAIGTAQAVRYMHEECPHGPIAHGDLQPSNIFLGCDLQPMICGFGPATLVSLEQASAISNNRCWVTLDEELLLLIKSDIFSFGVMLLRLFCRKSVPQDDKSLIEWAKPYLVQGAFHELLDEDSEVLDIHGLYRVMSAVRQCTRSNPISRPCMTEVISILKGEDYCIQSSPSDSSQ